MSKIIKITAFFLFFVMCFCVQNTSAALPDIQLDTTLCLAGQKCCRVDGVNTCVDESTTPCLTCLNKIETCTKGETETVHTAVGCTYTTKERTCCDGLSWSGWGGKCCSGDTPESSKTCTNSAGYTGTQTRTVSCNNETGEWNIGEWSACSATQVCDPGTTRECPTNPWQIQTCTPAGQWAGCTCENVGNGKVYCEGMPRKAGERCYNGGWAMDSCSGICCCSGSKPYFFKAVGGPYKGYEVAGCKSTTSPYEITYSCMCTYPDGTTGDFSDGLQTQPGR